MKLLLVNPPIYDFTAYDFWSRPLGLLSVAGQLRGRAEMRLFDFLDRAQCDDPHLRRDEFGRGEFPSTPIERPTIWKDIPRVYRRFGRPREAFEQFLANEGPFDFALVGTGMTYWYQGVREAIEAIHRRGPHTKIVLGGPYATLCPDHARSLGADLVVEGTDLSPLWTLLGVQGDDTQPPLWEAYPKLETGAMRLTWGCPFHCTYCCVPKVYPQFKVKPLQQAKVELELLLSLGAKHVAFYDDALLHRADEALMPFLEHVLQSSYVAQPPPAVAKENTAEGGCATRSPWATFHTPNAINARLMTPGLAEFMLRAGFGKIYLGFEIASEQWQQATGGKVQPHELAAATETLLAAGADRRDLGAYILLGHPRSSAQAVEDSMRLAHRLGLSIMLAEFSPIPGTPDGELFFKRTPSVSAGSEGSPFSSQPLRIGSLADPSLTFGARIRTPSSLPVRVSAGPKDEPLHHNKTACTIATLGLETSNRLKDLCRQLNRRKRSVTSK